MCLIKDASGIIGRHLPQTQEEEEGDEQSHHGDAVTQEVYDHSYLVVHLAFLLQGGQRHGTHESVGHL